MFMKLTPAEEPENWQGGQIETYSKKMEQCELDIF